MLPETRQALWRGGVWDTVEGIGAVGPNVLAVQSCRTDRYARLP